MTEPDVTLTDFAIALQGLALAILLMRRGPRTLRTTAWWIYFASAGLAALFGGLVHGFFSEGNTWGRASLWPLTLTAIGVNAVAATMIGATLVLSPAANRRLFFWAVALFVAYCGYVWLFDSRFGVAIVIVAPATIVLLVALLLSASRGRPGALVAAIGVALTLAAAAVQYFGIAFDPIRFNHNATAHVVQMASPALVFAGCLRILDSTPSIAVEKTPCSQDASF